jgi:antitoxin VapB
MTQRGRLTRHSSLTSSAGSMPSFSSRTVRWIHTSAMALSIKSDEADQLARELAAETGETLTEAVVIALRERLDREHARHAASMRTRLARLAADVAALPVADSRAPEEIIGYDDAGLPR